MARDYEPVKLTPEIMERCKGFEFILWNGAAKDYRLRYAVNTRKKFNMISLTFGMFVRFPDRLDRCYIVSVNGGNAYSFPVKYLHELQNAVKAFTGKELVFNMKRKIKTKALNG